MRNYQEPIEGYPDLRVYCLARVAGISLPELAKHVQATIDSGTAYRQTGWLMRVMHDLNYLGYITLPMDLSGYEYRSDFTLPEETIQ